jgi:hypothetical protein
MAPRFFCSGTKYKAVSMILTVQISYILVRIVGAWLICRVTFPESQRIFSGMLWGTAVAPGYLDRDGSRTIGAEQATLAPRCRLCKAVLFNIGSSPRSSAGLFLPA